MTDARSTVDLTDPNVADRIFGSFVPAISIEGIPRCIDVILTSHGG